MNRGRKKKKKKKKKKKILFPFLSAIAATSSPSSTSSPPVGAPPLVAAYNTTLPSEVSSSSSTPQDVVLPSSTVFSLRDLGSVRYFLGVELHRSSTGFNLSQHKYIDDLLHRAQLHDSKPLSTPLSASTRLTKSEGEPLVDPTFFRSIIGALQYITITCPEIAFAVNKVCQFMQIPTTIHWAATKRILRYLKGTITYGLLLQPCHTFSLVAYSNADWGSGLMDRCSQSGYCMFLGSNLISWSSKKQPTMACSSTESKYRSLASVATEVSWLHMLLQELGISISTTPLIWCDNMGNKFLANNPALHSRSKHIEFDIHFIGKRL
ncbi:PREDICTED: uncharacterized protein LOC109114468 [Nelumbo nucifera]|uniref:Uncharacterized protein LOC109114468 n=1 Tax=Nelumbo nucifera TaxID=4432 RepID=A0A1U8Q233_NELNU|nr:PREDICTED: uncharacterized protein LOC109114468 [Nelumbo nucifera]